MSIGHGIVPSSSRLIRGKVGGSVLRENLFRFLDQVNLPGRGVAIFPGSQNTGGAAIFVTSIMKSRMAMGQISSKVAENLTTVRFDLDEAAVKISAP